MSRPTPFLTPAAGAEVEGGSDRAAATVTRMRTSRAVTPAWSERRSALVGLSGAVLAGVGDLLILGRPSSGADFDRAAGVVPPHIAVDQRWRSLWNGVPLSRGRIRAGTVVGLVGIALVDAVGLRSAGRALDPGALRRVAVASAVAFGVSGAVTHLSCGGVILAYKNALLSGDKPEVRARPVPRLLTLALGAGAVGSLASLAVFSADLTAARLLASGTDPDWSLAVTPFPFVLLTLLTFGRLPAPVGGLLRPASISAGLTAYFAIAAAAAGVATAGPAERRIAVGRAAGSPLRH